jgi:hypothetical protein
MPYRTPPYVWQKPAIIYHDGISVGCLNAVRAQLTEPDVVMRKLPTSLKSTRGMIEIWLPDD